jgi:predicted ArsR family transcriptional regulator
VNALLMGPLSASEIGLAVGMSKSAVQRYLAPLADIGAVAKTGRGRATKWQLTMLDRPTGKQPHAGNHEPYTTIEALAEAVHNGLVAATPEQREVLEQAWQIAHRPRLTLIQGGDAR